MKYATQVERAKKFTQNPLFYAQIPLRRLCDKVRNKFPTKSQICRGHKSWKSATKITSPTFITANGEFKAV